MIGFNVRNKKMGVSEGSNSVPEPSLKKGKPRRKLYLIMLVVVLSASTLSIYYFAAPKQMWLEKDAFVELHGDTVISDYAVDVVWGYRLLGYNGSYVALGQYVVFESNVLNQENDSLRIIDMRNGGKDFINGNVTKMSEEDINIAGIGKRHCMVYEYAGGSIVYIDKDTMWPVRMYIKITKIEMDLTIWDTNIPKLQLSNT